jgi:hypothetical protein
VAEQATSDSSRNCTSTKKHRKETPIACEVEAEGRSMLPLETVGAEKLRAKKKEIFE